MSAALLAGLILYPVLGSVLPAGNWLSLWATGHTNGWDAGSDLMTAANPVSWNKLVAASNEITRQETAIKACRGVTTLFPAVPAGAATCEVILPKAAGTK